MEQYSQPSASLILRRIQRIRQCRLQEQSAEVRASDESMSMLLCQKAIPPVSGEYVVYQERPGPVVWGDFDDWHDAPARIRIY